MSFAKIVEARAVKKIVALLRAESKKRSDLGSDEFGYGSDIVIDDLVERIEAGEWKDIKLPKPEPKKKAK